MIYNSNGKQLTHPNQARVFQKTLSIVPVVVWLAVLFFMAQGYSGEEFPKFEPPFRLFSGGSGFFRQDVVGAGLGQVHTFTTQHQPKIFEKIFSYLPHYIYSGFLYTPYPIIPQNKKGNLSDTLSQKKTQS